MWINQIVIFYCIIFWIGGGLPPVVIAEDDNEWHVYQVVGRQLHNTFRAKHNIPPLKLNKMLNDGAQKFAEHLLKEKMGLLKNNNNNNKGFILNDVKQQQQQQQHEPTTTYKTYPKNVPLKSNDAVKLAVTKWYSLVTENNWKNQNYTKFLALAWKGTTDLGIGVATNGIRTIVVGAYSHDDDDDDDDEEEEENLNINHESKSNVEKTGLIKRVSTVRIRPHIYKQYDFPSRHHNKY